MSQMDRASLVFRYAPGQQSDFDGMTFKQCPWCDLNNNNFDMYYQHMVTCAHKQRRQRKKRLELQQSAASSDGEVCALDNEQKDIDIEQEEFLKGARDIRAFAKYVRALYRRVLKGPVIELNTIGFGCSRQ